MKRKEITIMAVLLVGSIITIFLPNTKEHKHIIGLKQLLYEVNLRGKYITTDEVAKKIIKKDPSLLLAKMKNHKVTIQGRYVTTDEVAKMIMEKDSTLLLIDVRSPKEYEKFTLEGAINIPFEQIMEDDNKEYLDQNVYTTILFSNGSSLADQVWLTLRSYDYKGNKVLRGGLNQWYKTIINPQEPAEDKLTFESQQAYLFRKRAQAYFTGASGSAVSSKPIVKRKKKVVSGGCG